MAARTGGDARFSALWGSGTRGGDARSLRGRGTRAALGALLLCMLAAPLSALADGGGTAPAGSFVAPGLAAYAAKHPGERIRVIVQSTRGAAAAEQALLAAGAGVGPVKRLGIVGGAATQIPAARLDRLAQTPGLTITPDAVTHMSNYKSSQLWPYESSNARLWPDDAQLFSTRQPAIAIVDSGVQARADFGSRLLTQVNLTSLPGNSPGDGRGHGTFVAGIAAGASTSLAGAAPAAKIVSLDVMDDHGMGLTSDVIAACQWILDNRTRYDIRVANFSLHSAMPSNFTRDPLDRAVEQLWFHGVTVVAAAGNYGTLGVPSGVRYAPGNDPFVITVGAVDLNGTTGVSDDNVAPWSAWGYTYDGFSKPDISADGRYMVGPVPAGSTLALERPDHVVSPGYMQLSGTSFAAPVVSGSAAQLLARHPDWTPDLIKGALMLTARPVVMAPYGSVGVGQITAVSAARLGTTPPNPNAALDRFLVPDGNGGTTFDDASWATAAQADASWATASWATGWSDASWATASWATASWATNAWGAASWATASLTDSSLSDTSHEDAAEADAIAGAGYELTPAEEQALYADPLLAPTLP
jgi:serine protease AprX